MKKLTTHDFVERARAFHGDKYDYSETEYTHSKGKVIIICPIHGRFEQRASAHLDGQGCPVCSIEKSRTKEEDFILRVTKTHGDKYDYSKVEYKNAQTKVCIICPTHGEFWQTPSSHLNGIGCPVCGHKRTTSLVCGVGINDVKEYNPSLYRAWKAMLSRCYGDQTKGNKNYGKVVVCKEWHTLSNFKKWWSYNYIHGLHLDKDIAVKGNKEYAPDKCCYVPNEINCLFTSSSVFTNGLNAMLRKNMVKYPIFGYDHISGKRVKVGITKDIKEAIRESIINKYRHAVDIGERYHADGLMSEKTLNLIKSRCQLEIEQVEDTISKVMDKFNEIKNEAL